MKIILFGATGMVGQGVLRECLLDSDVEDLLIIGRSPSAVINPKARELLLQDLSDYTGVQSQMAGYDACFFCLGVSSSGVSEQEYERITYGFTLAAAKTLSSLNPQMTFVYVSGAGTDSSEKGRVRWARVKGRTENALLRLPFAAAYMFRPGIIQPLHGATSKTKVYRIFYNVAGPLLPLLRRAFPNQVLTTEQIGRAMLNIVRKGYSKPVLNNPDIRALS